MNARDDLVTHFTRLLDVMVENPRRVAQHLVDRLPYVVDDVDEIETTAMGALERSFIRNGWITIKLPTGAEHVTLPYETPEEVSESYERVADGQ